MKGGEFQSKEERYFRNRCVGGRWYLERNKLVRSPACSWGSPVEDSIHVLCECTLYVDFRDIHALGVVRDKRGWRVKGIIEHLVLNIA